MGNKLWVDGPLAGLSERLVRALSRAGITTKLGLADAFRGAPDGFQRIPGVGKSGNRELLEFFIDMETTEEMDALIAAVALCEANGLTVIEKTAYVGIRSDVAKMLKDLGIDPSKSLTRGKR